MECATEMSWWWFTSFMCNK